MRDGRVVAALAVLLVLVAGGCTKLKRSAYEGFGRDGWQQPDRVIEALELEPGARVADLGAGGGYFTFRLADAAGPDGLVYAVDVDPGMLEYLRERAQEEDRRNVVAVAADYDDPRIPEDGVDLIFVCDTYHHIEDREAYFARAGRYLRPGGRVAIIDFLPEGWLQKLFPHGTDPEEVRSEMTAAGYRLEREHDFLERQSFLVFTRSGDG
jgi:ubiquinone/menaquinone biosynthesis C-methylase UbiE